MTGSRRGTGGRAGTVTAAVGVVLAMTALTAGCKSEATVGASAPSVPPGGAASSAAPSDDAKPGDTPSAVPSAPASPATATPSAESAEPTAGSSEEPRPEPERSTPSAPPKALMANGSRSDQVRELQARLRQIGHFDRSPTGYYGSVTVTAVKSFQGKRDLPRTGATDPVTWQRLLAMTRTPTADELRPPTERPVAKPDKRCLTGRVMCISKNSRTLSWMIDGRVVSSMDVRFGSEYTPTREGAFSVFWKSRDHVSTLYDSPMPYAMFFSGGQAVHYSSDFAARGYSGASHGCVNVRDEKKIASLFDQVRTGDKVVVYG
ncbi:L,D-transpeptidase family protein [Streptomyces sp. DT24]|uniref:L,D-transpeptidase family protein n=1 Tax=unclassified Streptomyces TaxID=2593676 RepID=UPI0023B9FA1B|nr:L,D-transpeptidase family protein [Streptomyces sp. AM 4-1-1]WEH35514.1 L,D-transpeptidase family protein [Streptomyces sp. AM 4-1-1]